MEMLTADCALLIVPGEKVFMLKHNINSTTQTIF